jgi:signal transduction histidine kinase
VDLAHVSLVTTRGKLTALLAHEDQPMAAAVMDASIYLRWLAQDQLDLEETRETMESAAGISISSSIVESHGGRLWIAGNSPRDASFYSTLPPIMEL